MKTLSLRVALIRFFLIATLFFVGTVVAFTTLVGRDAARTLAETQSLVAEVENVGFRVDTLRLAVADVRRLLEGEEGESAEFSREWIAGVEDRATSAALALSDVPVEIRRHLAVATDLEATLASLLAEALATNELGKRDEALDVLNEAEEVGDRLVARLTSAQGAGLELGFQRQAQYVVRGGRVRNLAIWASLLAVFLSGGVLFWLHVRFNRPFREVEAGLGRVASGDLETGVKVYRDDEIGRLAQILNSAAQNIKERAAAQALLTRGLSERLGRLMEGSPSEIVVFRDGDLRVAQMNATARRNLDLGEGVEEDTLTPLDYVALPQEEEFRGILEELKRGVDISVPISGRHRRSDGTEYPVEGSLQYSGDEDPPVFLYVVRDVTELRDREEHLRQAQKMEAIGQLTGGVAHDFNNLLTVIQGSLDLISEGLLEGQQNQRLLAEALKATERAGELTHHLLAFSRKQPLQPRPVDLNRVLADMELLLRRTLGEPIDIEIIRGGGVWKCEVDPAQIQTMILNLVLNARSAMPNGGKLTVETANAYLDDDYVREFEDVAQGQYVMVAITDTGVGMAPEIMERAFDPFFTTKDVGEGSGLGLSMVYGFVKQSRGHVRLYSELGKGTTARVYLPRFFTDEQLVESEPTSDPEEIPRGFGEQILVVEDEDLVREFAARSLIDLGYVPLEARDAHVALDILRREPPGTFNLLFTDVVLPGKMSGKELAVEAAAYDPDLPVLYTSGYTENAIIHGDRLDVGVLLLSKPYRVAKLARMIRKAMDRG